MEESVDWNDKLLKRWLDNTSKDGTRMVYRSAFRLYTLYTKLTPKQMIEEAVADSKLDVLERKDIVKTRLLGFHKWLMKECPVYSRGRETNEKHKVLRYGLAPKTADTTVNAARSFYSTFSIFLKLKGKEKLPHAKVLSKRMDLSAADVKSLLNHTTTPRDRAIILMMFQSGMDVSTLCSLRYKDVARGLEASEHPLKLDVHREKAGIDYYTFLGRDGIEALKAYLNDLKSKGVQMDFNTPLFLKGSNKALTPEGMTPNLIQNAMKAIGVRSGLVDKHMNGNSQNPVGTHALRESFSSIMLNKGVPDSIVDFWLGHMIGGMGQAYKRGRFEEVRQQYVEHEIFISVSAPTEQVMQIEEKLDGELATAKLELKAAKGELDLQKSKMIDVFTELDVLRKRMDRYEAFTQKFMRLSPEELARLGVLMEEQRIKKEIEETDPRDVA